MTQSNDNRAPVLPLRDVVVFPHMAIPLFVGREKSIKALEVAMESDKRILLVAQRSADVEDPGSKDLYNIGTLASILQLLKLPDGTVKVLVEGAERARIYQMEDDEAGYVVAECEAMPDVADTDEAELDAMMRSALGVFEQYVKLNKKVPAELLPSLSSMDSAGRLADTIAAHLNLRLEDKQQVLEMKDVQKRIEHVMRQIEGEIEVLQIEKKIRSRVKQQMEKSQREYYLNEQMKAIQKELGESEDAPNDMEELAEKIEKAGMPKQVKSKVLAEFNKLKMMSPMSAEATVVRNYVDWVVGVPWKKKTRSRIELEKAEGILNEDHYGLEQVKERIIENLAVQQRVKKLR
ncbi:MAG: LON peptidase substrate-binding domain-containing protein, partial [Salinisphaeraceae bacterium]|nr:LON peptidase substrate-binding domain-containing protein [Salinisphaeraceae bacterium]